MRSLFESRAIASLLGAGALYAMAAVVFGASMLACNTDIAAPPTPPPPMMRFTATCSPPTANSVSLQLNVESSSTLTVDVVATEVTDLASVYFDLAFRPDVLSFSSASEGAFMRTAGGAVEFVVTEDRTGSGDGRIVVGVAIVPATIGANGSGVIGSFTFSRESAGSTFLSFEASGATDSAGDRNGVSFCSGSVFVT